MLSSKELYEFLKANPIFRRLTDAQLNKIISLANELKMKAGQVVLAEGEFSDIFCVLKEGTLQVMKKDKHNVNYEIRTLDKNEVIGEIGLITNKPRSASIRALTDVVLITFPIQVLKDQTTRSSI